MTKGDRMRAITESAAHGELLRGVDRYRITPFKIAAASASKT